MSYLLTCAIYFNRPYLQYGFAPKGSSVILYRDLEQRHLQVLTFEIRKLLKFRSKGNYS